MIEPRLKTDIRIAAQVRRAQAAGAFAVIARRGDADAGALAVKVYLGAGRARAFLQSRDLDGRAIWRDPLAGEGGGDDAPSRDYPEAEVDARLKREASIDPDLWVIEIEDREGRAFLEDA